jgi:hypothetical protein
MARYERFTFLCDKDERRLIVTLAERLKRSQSDAVRFVVVTAVRELAAQDSISFPEENHPREGVQDATR